MAEPAATAPAPAKPQVEAPKPRFTARLRYARISARKMRYVVDLVRGKDYNNAIATLRACAKRGAMFCKKLLESAYGNAINSAREKNLDIDGNKLHLVEARVDPGPIIKRWRPSSVRRPNMIKKRLCHVTFVLEERDLKESRAEKAKRQRQERQKAAATTKAAEKQAQPAKGGAPAAKAEAPKPETPKKAETPKKEEKK